MENKDPKKAIEERIIFRIQEANLIESMIEQVRKNPKCTLTIGINDTEVYYDLRLASLHTNKVQEAIKTALQFIRQESLDEATRQCKSLDKLEKSTKEENNNGER